MFEAALRLDPAMLEATSSLAKIYILGKKHASAVAAAEKVLAADPADVEMLRVRHQGCRARRPYTGAGGARRSGAP